MITDQLASVEGKPTAATWDGVQWFHDSHAGAPPRSRRRAPLEPVQRAVERGKPLGAWHTLRRPTQARRCTTRLLVVHSGGADHPTTPSDHRDSGRGARPGYRCTTVADRAALKLLLRLVHAGSAVLEEGHNEMTRRRQHAIVASSGKYADAFSGDYLAELRRDWPE